MHDRSALLHKVADLLVANKAEVARAESLDTGKRLVECEYDVDDIVGVFRYYANIAAEDAGRVVDTGQAGRTQPDRARAGRRLRPDHALELPAAPDLWKVAPCLAAGNSFVLKPSELTPSTAILLMQLPDRGRSAAPASATSCSAPVPTRAPRSRPTPTSTWSRSPVACRPAGS